MESYKIKPIRYEECQEQMSNVQTEIARSSFQHLASSKARKSTDKSLKNTSARRKGSPAFSDDPEMRGTKHKLNNDEVEDSEQEAVLETAKDKLRMATIERKRMTSLNAESRGNRQTRSKSKNAAGRNVCQS